MALKLRLARGGSKKRPYYSIVVADARMPRDGRFIEKIGAYNPLLAKDDENRVKLDTDRAKHWLERGAQPTERVSRFLGTAGLVEYKHGDNPQKGEPGQKAKERAEERAERERARIEAEEEAKNAPAEESAEEGTDDASAEAPAETEAAE